MGDDNTTKTSELLSPEFLTKLDQLSLVSRRILQGKMRGERISKRRGESVEFADHRSYVAGDDLRFLDWNIFARLDRLFIKLFLEEEDLHVSVLFDVSKSMDWGDPHKGMYARRLAAAIAYIGLVNFDRVSLYGYSDGLQYELSGVRGRRFMYQVVDFLSHAKYEGTSNLAAAGKQFSVRHPQPGIVMIVSDFFEKDGYETGLRFLLARKYDIYAVQTLSPEEMEPAITGDLKLMDVEDGDTAEVTVTRALLDRYKKNLEGYCATFKQYCTQRGIMHLFTSTRVPFDQLVLMYFQSRGLIK